jgi:hypothetical protein
MSAGIGPHKASEPGYIVAWHSKRQFWAGKYLNEVMTFGEAQERAETLSRKNTDLTFWAEHEPQKFDPH